MLALNAWRLLSPCLGCNFRAGACRCVYICAYAGMCSTRMLVLCVCAHVLYDVNSYAHDKVIVCACTCYLYLYQSFLLLSFSCLSDLIF